MKFLHPSRLFGIFLSVAFLLVGLSVQASEHTWNVSTVGGGLWSDAGNWTGGVPDATDANVGTPSAFQQVRVDGDYDVGAWHYNAATSWNVRTSTSGAAQRLLTINGGFTKEIGGGTLSFSSDDAGHQLSLNFLGTLDSSAGILILGANDTTTRLNHLTVAGMSTISGNGTVRVNATDAQFNGGVTLGSSNSNFYIFFNNAGNASGGVKVAGLSGSAGTVATMSTSTIVSGTTAGRLTISGTNNTTFGGVIKDFNGTITGTAPILAVDVAMGSGGVQKMTGESNTYTGGTTVTSGILLANNASGSGIGTGNVTVKSEGILGGTGNIALSGANIMTVEAGGMISAGDGGSGVLTINFGSTTGGLSMQDASGVAFDLGPSNTSNVVRFYNYTSGDFTNLGTTVINLTDTQIGTYTVFNFYTNAGTTLYTGSFDTSAFNVVAGDGFSGSMVYDGNGAVVLTVTAVPEPTAGILVGFAALCLIGYRRLRG